VNVICDTDVLIDYLDHTKIRHNQTANVLNEEVGLKNIVISAVTKMELMMGIKNKENQIKLLKTLKGFSISLINNDITLEAINLLEEYKLSHGLSIPDCLIAATAIKADLPLFTYNVKDFSFIKDLKLYNAAFTK
jgi:hypothetical protein